MWCVSEDGFTQDEQKQEQNILESCYSESMDNIRRREYPHLQGTAYLDHAGITPYARSLIQMFSSDLKSRLYGNPHSQSSSSTLSTSRIEDARLRMLDFFKADRQHFDLVFVANATAAIKLVADAMRDNYHEGKDEGFWYGYHAAAHTSLVGVRQVANAGSTCFGSDEEVESWLAGVLDQSTAGHLKRRLFAYPAQSNMNGRRLPLDWASRLRESVLPQHQNTYTLLDAAAYVTTAQLDLSDHTQAPDFVALSFHKIFGFPDLGALIVRKEASSLFRQRSYFGGGTVDMVINGRKGESWHASKISSLHEALEDGTPAFHSIVALEPALNVHRKVYGDMAAISAYTCRLSSYLYAKMSRLIHANGIALCHIYKDPRSGYGDAKSQGPTIAFNLRSSTKKWIRKSHVEQLAIVNNIQLRTGGVCNPGGIAWALNLTPVEMRENFAEGLRCGNEVDELNGKPTGIVRVSLGGMSTMSDIGTLLAFLSIFLEADPVDQNGMPTSVSLAGKRPQVSGSLLTEKGSIYPTQDLPLADATCPVARCKISMPSEEALIEHFKCHKVDNTSQVLNRQPMMYERYQANLKSFLRGSSKQLGKMSCRGQRD